jgi:hypothetical protein
VRVIIGIEREFSRRYCPVGQSDVLVASRDGATSSFREPLLHDAHLAAIKQSLVVRLALPQTFFADARFSGASLSAKPIK